MSSVMSTVMGANVGPPSLIALVTVGARLAARLGVSLAVTVGWGLRDLETMLEVGLGLKVGTGLSVLLPASFSLDPVAVGGGVMETAWDTSRETKSIKDCDIAGRFESLVFLILFSTSNNIGVFDIFIFMECSPLEILISLVDTFEIYE
jgi:hypothetical protein